MKTIQLIACLSIASSAWLVSAPSSASTWKLQDAMPSNAMQLRGYTLLRLESLDGQFRNNAGNSEELLSIRTSLQASWDVSDFSLNAEMTDSRQYLSDDASPLNTGIVNTLEWTQAYLAYQFSQPFQTRDKLILKLGRQSLDLGSRRLIAHTRFRNTTNSFTGFEASWTSDAENRITALYLLPVMRRPTSAAELHDNERQSDIESSRIKLYGVFLERQSILPGLNLDVTVLKLKEADTPAIATANRDLMTAGFRLAKKASPQQIGAQLESYYQWGEAYATNAATDVTPLDHKAWFVHAQLDATFKHAWKPTLQLLYDYASGDKSPDDKQSNRFQRLYGVSRPDLGPTGIFGSFAFENISSPGLRLSLLPNPASKLILTWRKFDLAENRDAWTKAKLRDKTGQSGGDLGHQIEAKVVWKVVPKTVVLEAGFAQLFGGDFAQKAAGSSFDSKYGYIQTKLSF